MFMEKIGMIIRTLYTKIIKKKFKYYVIFVKTYLNKHRMVINRLRDVLPARKIKK